MLVNRYFFLQYAVATWHEKNKQKYSLFRQKNYLVYNEFRGNYLGSKKHVTSIITSYKTYYIFSLFKP